jgi:transglutaminase-like putative cysteine protease
MVAYSWRGQGAGLMFGLIPRPRRHLFERPRPGQIAAVTGLYAIAGLTLILHLAPAVLGYFYLLLGYRAVAARLPRLEPGRWILLPLALVGVLLVYRHYGTLVGQEGGSALLTLLLALKLLEIRSPRDVRLLTMLFAFWLVIHFLFEQSFWAALFLGALLILDVAMLADSSRSPPRPPLQVLGLAFRLTLQALPLTLVLFILFPRLDAPLWSFLPAEDQARTGINDWLEPGSVSELVLDGSLAFRVRFDGPFPQAEGLYWRGPVAWNTDGRRWQAARPDQFSGLVAVPARSGDAVSYEVTLEPSRQRWLFALDLPMGTPEKDAYLTHDFQLLAKEPIKETRVYRVTSAPAQDTGDLPEEQRAAGLALPTNVTARMRELVAEWAGVSPGPAAVVQAGLRHFHQQAFYYSLRPPRLGNNPADEFLFETRKGFCEHYASSFTLLMRIAGIPARIVMGFLGGERNPLGAHLIVRQSDAHAWVEVWLEGQGWTRVDPTAAVAPERVEPSPELTGLASGRPLRLRIGGVTAWGRMVHGLRLFGDALDENWYRWVLGLDRSRQQALLDGMGLGWLREYGLAVLMVLAASLVMGLLLVVLLWQPPSSRPDPLDRLYRKFCSRLARAGLPRKASEGPCAYGQRLALWEPGLSVGFLAFTGRYARLRYGPGPVGKVDLEPLKRELQATLAMLRQARRGRYQAW